MPPGRKSLGTAERIALLRSATLLQVIAKRLVLEEPGAAELGVLQRELLKPWEAAGGDRREGVAAQGRGEDVLTVRGNEEAPAAASRGTAGTRTRSRPERRRRRRRFEHDHERERKNGATAAAGAAPPRYGEAAPRLKSLGYFPTPWPRSEIPPALCSEHLCAVGGTLAVLMLGPIADPQLNERVRAELKARGLLAGPVRVGVDGVESRPLRFTKLWRPTYAAIDEAVVLQESCIVLLDAAWPTGSLLEIHHDSLPQVPSADQVIGLFDELQALPHRLAAERRPAPRPTRAGWTR